MARIVINISDEDYKTILNSKMPYAGEPPMYLVWIIRAGQVLPKGHGDLIDRNELFTEYPEIAIEPYINAPIVIEADKENDDER